MPIVVSKKKKRSTSLKQICLTTLEASANDNGHLYPDEYLIFSDGMSNGYYTLNNITTYSDLPYPWEFGHPYKKYGFTNKKAILLVRPKPILLVWV